MATLEKISVSAKALRQVLVALNGPPHYIRELQVTRNPIIDPDNPLNVLTDEFNAAVEAFNAKTEDQKDPQPNDGCCSRCQKTEITQHDDGSASCTGNCEEPADLHLQRMTYIYEYSMAALVKPVMSFDEWLAKLDTEIAKNTAWLADLASRAEKPEGESLG